MNMTVLELDDVNDFLLEKQHLSPRARVGDIPKIVKDITALHATRPSTSYISLHARMNGFTRKYLERELFEKKTLGKIKCMRKTVHIVNREFLSVAYGATRDILMKNGKRYCKYLGISDRDYRTISRSIMDALEGREMTAGEIRETIGGTKETSSIINLMCDQGLLIRGPAKSWKGTGYRYSIFSEYFPDVNLDEMSEAQTVGSLVHRYLHSFGPVTERDISWWSGLGKSKILKALNGLCDDICRVRISGSKSDYVMLAEDRARMGEHARQPEPVIDLLPCLDPYIMGYKDRERYLSEDLYHMIFDRSGNGTSTILIDGRVEGVWDVEEKPIPMVKVHLFGTWSSETMETMRNEAKRTGAFICDSAVVDVKVCSNMAPLDNRTAGGFMTPLKGC